MGPDHFSPVARAPQGLAQVRIVEHVPEPIYHVPISPRLIGNHLLDRSQGKREKCVATAFQRRPYGLRTDEFAEPHHQRGVTQGTADKFWQRSPCATLMVSTIMRSELTGRKLTGHSSVPIAVA